MHTHVAIVPFLKINQEMLYEMFHCFVLCIGKGDTVIIGPLVNNVYKISVASTISRRNGEWGLQTSLPDKIGRCTLTSILFGLSGTFLFLFHESQATFLDMVS